MSFLEWLDKYIPLGEAKRISITAGIDEKNISRWKQKGVEPRTLMVIYVSKAISKEFGHDYKEVVISGLRAAARLRK